MRTYRNDELRRTHANTRFGINSQSTSYSTTHSSNSQASSNVTDHTGICSSSPSKYYGGARSVGRNHELVDDLETMRRHRSTQSNKSIMPDVPKRTIRTLMPVRRASTSKQITQEPIEDPCEDIDVTEVTSRSRTAPSSADSDPELNDVKSKRSLSSSMFPHIRVGHTKSLRMVRRRHMTDFHMEPLMKKRKSVDSDESSQCTPVTAASHRQLRAEARRDELIKCTCGFAEEDGLMIQCDLCLCWQHGICNNIKHEDDVPDKYICFMCSHPLRERPSKHFLRDQDWLKEGCLPSLGFRSKNSLEIKHRTVILKRSNDLVGTLLHLQKFVHSLRVKVNIAELPDHPKLYLWNQSWEKSNIYSSEGNVNEVNQNNIEPLLSEVEDLKEENLLLDKYSLNDLDNSPKHLEPTLSTSGGSVCHDADGNSTECQSTDMDGETGDFCSISENSNILSDVCGDHDSYYGGSSTNYGKEVDLPLELWQSQIELEDTLPDLSQDLILDSSMNIENETDVDTENVCESKKEETSIADMKENSDINNSLYSDYNVETPPKIDHEDRKFSSSVDVGDMDVSELQFPFCQKELINLASSMVSKLNSLGDSEDSKSVLTPSLKVPEPEVPIDLTECRLTLLDHIEVFQVQLELHLTTLETQISGLESMDPHNTHNGHPDHQTKETVQMLLHDLSLLHDVALIN